MSGNTETDWGTLPSIYEPSGEVSNLRRSVPHRFDNALPARNGNSGMGWLICVCVASLRCIGATSTGSAILLTEPPTDRAQFFEFAACASFERR